MTLFIDNIRLYKRELYDLNDDKQTFEHLMQQGTVLDLCSKLNMNFIIFTNLEDVPIDDKIHDLIPKNVLAISAINAVSMAAKYINHMVSRDKCILVTIENKSSRRY